MDDRQLLDQFVKGDSQSAFRELVERHLPIVYSAARRMVRDSHLAEEVAQTVFTTLAQKAPSIRPPQVLGGWLYNTTRHVAMHVVRTEQRRRAREQTAFTMQSLNQPTEDPEIAEHLEPAMAELSAEDRDALVLRFLADRAFREVGLELGISEEAARKRVTRAIDRLRLILQRRSIPVTGVLLTSALAASTIAVPSGLSAAITTAALATKATTVTTSTTLFAKLLSAKTVAGMIGVLVVGTGTLLLVQSLFLSPATPTAAALPTPSTQTRPAPALVTGIVKTADGRPLANAEVLLSTAFVPVPVYSDRSAKVQSTVTGSDGRFGFPADSANRAVIVLHEKGYGQASVGDLAKRAELLLQPWAHIEGTLRQGARTLADQSIRLSRSRFGSKLQERIFRTVHDTKTTTDAQGLYVFARVAPGDTWICWRSDKGNYDVQYRYVDVQPGQSLTVDIGGRGRPITGRAQIADNEERVKFFGSVWPKTLHQMKRPPNWSELSPDEQEALTAAWENTADAKIYNQERCPIDFRIAADGSFTVPDLPAGDYRVVVASWTGAPVTSQMISRGQALISIDEMPGGRSDEPLDIGTVEAFYTRQLRPGDPAPLFEAKTFDGKSLKLADHKGQHVLLNFWRTDLPGFPEDMEALTAAQSAWGNDKRLVVIGLNFDATLDTARTFIAEHKLTWTQCFIGQDAKLPARYRLRGPASILIGPEGRIIHPDLHGREIASALEEAFATK